jgi:FAD/FMN-containing dehydrogenase
VKNTLWRFAIRNRVKIGLSILLAIVAPPTLHLGLAAWHDRSEQIPLPSGIVEDASHLHQTRMTIVEISNNLNTAKMQLQRVLQEARSKSKKVTISGSRHTMGGQTIYPNGIALDMSQFKQMQFDPSTKILTVQSGAKWAEVIPYLNQQGYSIAVMQSNNDFSVGGTMSANAHGWQPNHPPFASTVESFQLMLADGKIVKCSRQENTQLFSLVLGGYGLFGIILDVNLRVVPDRLYSAQRVVIPIQKYIRTYRNQVSADVGMAYGRISVAPDSFLQEAILATYHQVAGDRPLEISASESKIARTVFVGSIGSDYGKKMRWQLEKMSGGEAGNRVSRNQILNRSATLFGNHKQGQTDILHEYFIPPESLELFLEKCRQIIPKHQVDLLNVTVRNIYPDRDTLLRYADREMFGLVMLFHQQRNSSDDEKMQKLTQALIEAALEVGGRYYLPYRLHATPDQFDRAYPQATEFFQLKRRYDPNEVFQNYFYLKYGKSIRSTSSTERLK